MVRLVFRPYAQIRRSICTSEPLRASTRVSSGFTLSRHSSPSFGSQQPCSHSNPSEHIRIGRWCAPEGVPTSVHFHSARGFDTQTLAWMLDSLVRVSRRVADDHCASILAEARSSVPAGGMTPGAITLPEGSHVPRAFLPPPEPMLARARASTPVRTPTEHSRPSLVAGASLSTISRAV